MRQLQTELLKFQLSRHFHAGRITLMLNQANVFFKCLLAYRQGGGFPPQYRTCLVYDEDLGRVSRIS